MPSTVSGIVDTVRLRVDHSSLTDTQVIDLINNVQRRLQREFPINFNETHVAITISTAASSLQSFTLPTDLNAPLQLYALVSGEYNPVTYKADFFGLVSEFAGATAGKAPLWWSQYGGTGFSFPIQTTSVNTILFYDKVLADFGSSGTGSNSILNLLPSVLEYGTIAEYYDNLAEVQKADVFRRKAADALNAFLKKEKATYDRVRSTIPETPGTVRRFT